MFETRAEERKCIYALGSSSVSISYVHVYIMQTERVSYTEVTRYDTRVRHICKELYAIYQESGMKSSFSLSLSFSLSFCFHGDSRALPNASPCGPFGTILLPGAAAVTAILWSRHNPAINTLLPLLVQRLYYYNYEYGFPVLYYI